MAAGSSIFGQSSRRAAGDPALRARDERLEALKAVVGKLAHDFNNFLVPQFGYLTLVSEELPGESTAAQYLKTMEGAARTTEGYIESILLAVRPQRQYSPKDFELGALVKEEVAAWAARIPASTEVRVETEIAAAPLHGDERHWRKLIEHLLSNARFALATGGTLRVVLRATELSTDEMQRLGLRTLEVYCLEVQDSGFGIPEQAMDRVFEPFFTSRAQSRGSGLGLTIVHTVAHFHDGQVELRSGEDQGTTLTVWIPRTAPTMGRSVVSGLLRQKPVKKRKVLLVEDDRIVEQAMRGWIAALNFDVLTAETPSAAAKILARDPAGISLVITETVFPEGRGEEVWEAVTKVGGLSCVFLAGRELPGRDAPILRKPISIRAFTEAILEHARG
jgi:two-component system cell cycle sensor histidine kinase/response regulator CckA